MQGLRDEAKFAIASAMVVQNHLPKNLQPRPNKNDQKGWHMGLPSLFVLIAAALSALFCSLWTLHLTWHKPQSGESLMLQTQLISQSMWLGGLLGAVFDTMIWMANGDNTLADAMVAAAFSLMVYCIYVQMGTEKIDKEE